MVLCITHVVLHTYLYSMISGLTAAGYVPNQTNNPTCTSDVKYPSVYVTYRGISMYRPGLESPELPGGSITLDIPCFCWLIVLYYRHYLGKVWRLNENPAVLMCIPFIRDVL